MRSRIFLQGLISFLIVAFGQPSFSPYLAPIAGAAGYAIFWRAIRVFPFWHQKFWRGVLWYGSISLIQLSWMTSIEFQGIYLLFVWAGLSLWLGVQFGLLTILIPYNRPLKLARILAIASLWTLLEWSRFYFLCGYSWNLSGLALSSTYAMQLASVFGVLGLSFWVVFVNLLGLRALGRKRIIYYVFWAGAAAGPYLFGLAHVGYHEKRIARIDESFNCALVQTGMLPSQKIPLQGKINAFITPYDQWRRILTFLDEHREKSIDLIALPEAAVPFSCGANLYESNLVKRIFHDVYGAIPDEIFPVIKAPYGLKGGSKVTNAYFAQALSNFFESDVVIGLDHIQSDGKSFNSAFFAKPYNSHLIRYDKQVLMPLAEYLPLKCLAPLVRSYGISDFFTHGEKACIFNAKIPVSASICYEETFPEKVRMGRLLGSKMIVNLTNDGWYPNSKLPSQHFEHARFRTVENGIPLVRACNTGVSAAVDSLGRTIVKLEERSPDRVIQTGAVFAQIIPYDYKTLFSVWGNKGILALCFIFITVFIVLKRPLRL